MAKQMRDETKERRWRQAVVRFAASGLSVRAFCRRENLAESAFYYWRRELARRDAASNKRAVRRPLAGLPGFVPVYVTDPGQRQASIVLELASGRRLLLPEDIVAARLAEIVTALDAEAGR